MNGESPRPRAGGSIPRIAEESEDRMPRCRIPGTRKRDIFYSYYVEAPSESIALHVVLLGHVDGVYEGDEEEGEIIVDARGLEEVDEADYWPEEATRWNRR